MDNARILVIHLRSTFKRLVSGKKDSAMAKLVEAKDSFVDQIVHAHETHNESLEKVESAIKERGLSATWRTKLSGVDSNEFDLVVTVGGDGTVLHASHFISTTPVLGVNSSPRTSAGFFTAAVADEFGSVLDSVLQGKQKAIKLCRMKIEIEGKVVEGRALNDALFCHDCPASTTRYALTFEGQSEDHLSSGVWVSTAAGSTAAIRAAGGRPMPAQSKRLQFVVREPFPSGGAFEQSVPGITKGFISDSDLLTIRSKTEAARLYIDGPHVVFPVDFGDRVTFSRSAEPLRIFGYNKKEE